MSFERTKSRKSCFPSSTPLRPLLRIWRKPWGRRPVKVGKDGTEIFVYRGDVANRALQMIGNEVDLFKDKKEVAVNVRKFERYSDVEIIEMLVAEGKLLLEARKELHEDAG
jgi:hypothetical protein